jgi:hypothetical protein
MNDATPTRCPRCGVEKRPDPLDGICPACLLALASEPVYDLSDAITTLTPPGDSATPSGAGSGAGATLAPGQAFGPYRIVRLLGRGGMGDVYEAEQIDQVRRVALKVLSQRLTDPHDRARFLREGQLAASINHPHSVYIFGSEEIAGTPVIAMELLAGGTLKDRVREQGPLPPAEAVDAIRQIIAGLDAVQAGGILHRDIKPANCFIDHDGTVKVGDFGLSISTTARDVTQLTKIGGFHGTPQFAAPEQIKGEPLDVRADIYAVGATLNYLLTGQPPFDDTNLMALLTRIATEVPRSPRALQPRVPRALAAIVLRCLAKDRTARPATYAALDEVLRPFGSTAATPATLGLRFLAGAIDLAVVSMALMPANFVIMMRQNLARPWWMPLLTNALMITYFAIMEGFWSASIGKRLLGLEVTSDDDQPPGPARACLRAIVWLTPVMAANAVLFVPPFALDQKRTFEVATSLPSAFGPGAVVQVLLTGLLFSTARRRNGFAAVHELASRTRTRVVRRLDRSVRSVLDAYRDSAAPPGGEPHCYGPYQVVRTMGATDLGEVWLGFDPRLRRHVWIHALPTGAPAVAPIIRDLRRPARLRWLTGRRSMSEAWDAYEALAGLPLAKLFDAPQPWRMVRGWLLDLAREIDAGLKDGTIAALTIDRVWIAQDGYAKLLDFRAPGVQPAARQEGPATLESGQAFLESVARSALARTSCDVTDFQTVSPDMRFWLFPRTVDGSSSAEARGAIAAAAREPLPLAASAMLETLTRRGLTSWSDVVARTTALLHGPARVGYGRRAVALALCGAFPTMMAIPTLAVLPLMSRIITPDVMALGTALGVLSRTQNVSGNDRRERAALEVYVAGRFGPMIMDSKTWTMPATAGILAPQRALAEQIVADHPNVSAEDLRVATAALGPILRVMEWPQRQLESPATVWKTALTMFGISLAGVALCGIVWAFVLRGGLLLRLCSIAVVTLDGQPASRLRALRRGLVGWGLAPASVFLGFRFGFTIGASAGVLFLAGAAWALAHPTRGLQDRIAGTWLVPL